MIRMKLLLLLLPAVALASIEVRMFGSVFFDSRYIHGSITQRGSEQRLIINNDRNAFQIEDLNLKSAIERYLGKKPDEIFLTGNTPSGDLHSMYGWSPVQVKIEPGTTYLIDMNSKEEVLTRTIYENVYSTAKLVPITESATTRDTVTSYWINPRQVSGKDVDIGFNYYVENDVVSSNHAYTFGFNRRTVTPQIRSLNGTIYLAPRQKVYAQFEAKKGSMKLQIPYKVSLSGDVAVRYNYGYNGKSIYNVNINQIMDANQQNGTLTVYQTFVIEFYYGHKVRIVNAQDGYSVLTTIEPEGGTSDGRRRAGATKHAAETGSKITMKAAMAPSDLNDEDLKAIEEEVVKNELDEESSESTKD